MNAHDIRISSLLASDWGGETSTSEIFFIDYDSFLKELPFQTQENMHQMLEGFRRIRALAPSDSHIVPGHDPAVLSRYPAPSPDLAGIVARLDVNPSE